MVTAVMSLTVLAESFQCFPADSLLTMRSLATGRPVRRRIADAMPGDEILVRCRTTGLSVPHCRLSACRSAGSLWCALVQQQLRCRWLVGSYTKQRHTVGRDGCMLAHRTAHRTNHNM